MRRKALIVLGWLAAWQLAAWAVGRSVVLAGPIEAAGTLVRLALTAEFWRTAAFTMLRIAGGFLAAFCAGTALGAAAWRWRLVREILAPAVGVMKSVPVACFVVLILVWLGSGRLTAVIVFLIAFPVLYLQTIEGLERTDRALLEMAEVFRMGLWSRVRGLYLPALLPSLESGCSLALGLAWKSGVAAEVIGTPLHSIGQELYFAKIYLEIDRLFAWTVVILLGSLLFERGFLYLLRRCAGALEGV